MCEYFYQLLECYPLNGEGFKNSSPAAYETLNRYRQKALSHPEDEVIIVAMETAEVAEGADFLLLRPTAVPSATSALPKEVEEESENTGAAGANDALRVAPLFHSDDELIDFITQLVLSPPFPLYHRILADEGLTPSKWRAFLEVIIKASRRLRQLSSETIICVFVDELNTAGCLGMVTEAFTAHSLDGEPLPKNIFFVGAVNPLRGSTVSSGAMDFTESDVGAGDDDCRSGYLDKAPYIVRPLSPSMERLKIWYPNLSETAEQHFISGYLRLHLRIDPPVSYNLLEWKALLKKFINTAAKAILRAQSLVRSYDVPRVFMSIRNLVRCSHLLCWLINFNVPTSRGVDGVAQDNLNIFLPSHPTLRQVSEFQEIKRRMQCALVMAISVTYWFQLPSIGHVLAGKAKKDLRGEFIADIVVAQDISVKEWKAIITDSLSHLFSLANIPRGIAHTTALKENFYCVVLACMNRIPLLITGPPGCGKTLSFMLACDALKGNCPLHTIAFQHLPKARKITYQCSVASTGPEIAAICEGAIVKQQHLDSQQPKRNICVLGIDEAGLTPENRQALKSLHDFLDMREIGTVMMSNTTLDAAKTSRTIQLLQTQVPCWS